MEKEPFLSKTEHILYICYNTRYHGGKGDMNEFERTIPLINVYEPTSLLSGEHYTPDYIAGMYPELENALKDYKKQIQEKAREARARREREGLANTPLFFSDKELAEISSAVIKKYNLKDRYDFSSPPTKEQQERINHRLLPKQKRELKKIYTPTIFHIGMALAEKCKDSRLIHKFMYMVRGSTEAIATGEIDKKTALEHMNIEGVPLGLDLLELREKGILDKDLNIKDMDKFMHSKVMTAFKFEGKTYNLSEKTSQSATINPGIIR